MDGTATNHVDLDWVDAVPVLDDLQAGALRRIRNLAAQLPDDWSGMMGRTTLQEDFGALRFQLAYMSYALALTHVHRLPAAPALFREPFDRLIQKILSPDCWLYWHYVSTGNGPFNSALGELPPEWNPVVRDNIMYSAYVQSMALLYHYLFRDPKYAAEGALTFAIEPLFWGAGGKRFAYDERSLNDHLYWAMVERGYLGIACEPNCVFQICNQPPIFGFRMHDLVYGGDMAGEVTAGYLRAWAEFGIATPNGSFNMMVQEHERRVMTPPDAPWVDFWLGSLMHAWNPELVEAHFPAQLARWSVDGPGGTLSIRPSMALGGGAAQHASARDFGWAAVCASEVGDEEALSRLLAYADRFLHAGWDGDAYYYRRHDEWLDGEGRLAAMDPHTGNALLAYARLNVPGGLKQLYDGPWHDRHFAQPALVGMPAGLDLRRAWYDPARDALVLTLGKPCSDEPVALEIGNLGGRARPRLFIDGHEGGGHVRAVEAGIVVEIPHKTPTTLVLQW